MHQAVDKHMLRLAMAQVDPACAEVFMLREVKGLSMREIAELVTIPRGTASSRLRRARAQIRAATARLEAVLKQERSPRGEGSGRANAAARKI